MKIIEGQFSPTPSRPHTGLLGILIKHREQLEPGNKITGNAASQLLALSRAIIEGFGGERVGDGANAQWEVEIGGTADRIDPAKVAEAILQVQTYVDKMSGYLDRVQSRISSLEEAEAARMSGIQEMSAELREQQPDPRIDLLEQQNAKLQSALDVAVLRLADAEKTVDRLAADMSRLEASLRPAGEVEPFTVADVQPVAKRPGRRALADLPPIGIPPKVATEK